MKESRKLKKSRDQNRTKRSKKTCGISWKQTAHTANFLKIRSPITLLIADIQKRGTIVEYNNGGGQSGYKKNEAVDMFNKTNAQMLKLLSELGLKANATIGGGDFDDEL